VNASVTLITAAAYIDVELAAEFGPLPPSFLPFGHGRLLSRQIALVQGLSDRTVMTLPESFTPEPWDSELLREGGVEMAYIPDDMSLGESIRHALALIDADGPLRILHGDTLFAELNDGLDEVGVSYSTDSYRWGVVEVGLQKGFSRLRPSTPEQEHNVLTGWFAFSSASDFSRAITLEKGDFLRAIGAYDRIRPLRVRELPDWMDFGHLQTFYRCRARANTARAFNSIAVSDNVVSKSGVNQQKLNAEAEWFEALPPNMRLYTPPYLGKNETGYRIGYEFSPTLHELFVFGRLEIGAWRNILDACFGFLQECLGSLNAATQPPAQALASLALDKTFLRLEQWSRSNGVDLDRDWKFGDRPLPSLRRIVEETGLVAQSPALPGVMHGDFCFPNIFFDFRRRAIKVIDPRGSVTDGKFTVFGDLQYDLAKLNHSIEGYDQILSGRFTYRRDGDYHVNLELATAGAAAFLRDLAREYEFAGRRLTNPVVAALTVQLFLSMLPLHSDRPDRQKAFLANALRIYSSMETNR
jgi:hypothetical protein